MAPPAASTVGGVSWGAVMMTIAQRCKPKSTCPDQQWQCLSGACISPQFLCDSRADCEDKSDEDDARCDVRKNTISSL